MEAQEVSLAVKNSPDTIWANRCKTECNKTQNSTLTIEEFHSKLQEATNFPLRPFVVPFLKANLPLLQRELLHCARLAKQNPAQYLAQHEQLLLDTSTTSPVDSSDLLLDVNENGKRRTPDRTKENGFERDGAIHPDVHPTKRPCTMSPAQRFSPSNGLSYQPNGLPHPGPLPAQHYRLDDMAIAHHYRDTYRHPASNHREVRERARPIGMHAGSRQEEVIDHRLTDREWAEEWKHLDHLLNCIMDMVEKTRRSLTVLRRCQEADREELNYWIRRYSDAEELKKGAASGQSRQQSPAAQENATSEIHRELLHRPVSGYVPEEIWKKAAFSSQDELTPGKEEEIGKDGTVWTMVGEEESRERRQSQNALTERQIQDAQTAFLYVADAEMLIHIQGCSVAEARRVLEDDSSSDMSVDELKAFLALVYVREVKGERNMELSSFWSD
ncbi:Protein CBFA2T1 [Crenichthys baileyi]|uniref:Protein CBFA2T1 n=1 Tax=Crenichthys baileyi TaxID=28760 RepID=A0AAV9R5B0_9TELE